MSNESMYKSQQKGGEMRVENASRDEKGRFGKVNTYPSNQEAGCPEQTFTQDTNQLVQEAYEPAELDEKAYEPAGLDCGASEPAHISGGGDGGCGDGGDSSKLKRWEMHIETAMEDIPWLEIIAMQTKLPVFNRKTEIVEHFKRHVIAQGNEDDILSVRDAKRYFANCTRIGTLTNKRLVEELENSAERVMKTVTQKDVYRYENRDPRTGERSYFGITIPPGTPPRPNEEAVLVNGEWT